MVFNTAVQIVDYNVFSLDINEQKKSEQTQKRTRLQVAETSRGLAAMEGLRIAEHTSSSGKIYLEYCNRSLYTI